MRSRFFVFCFTGLLCVCLARLEAGHNKKYRGVNRALEMSGDIGQVVVPAAALITSLSLKDYKGTLQFVEAGAATAATVIAFKCGINEKRPRGKGHHSFPSGHTAAAFCGAAFVQWRYGGLYSLPLYAAAVVVGYSRIQAKVHWTHDVVAGAAIGFLFSFAFTTPYHPKKIEIVPAVTSDGLALHCRKQF